MEENIQRFRIELQQLYEADKKRLFEFQREYISMKNRLERENVLEALNLHNCRAQLEAEIEIIENQIEELSERKAQYDLLFM